MLDQYLKTSDSMLTNVSVLLAKLSEADNLLEDMRRLLTQTGTEGQTLYRVEEVIAALKRLRWCMEDQMKDRKDGRQTEAILRFPS